MQLNQITIDNILESTYASDIRSIEIIQSLWSNYGVLARVFLKGGDYDSVIVKDIDLSKKSSHPRNWNTNASHKRKLRSYEVETNFYKNFDHLRSKHSYFPQLISSSYSEDKIILILEDLSTKGFSLTIDKLNKKVTHIKLENYGNEHGNRNYIFLGLSWLANFHAKGLNKDHSGLWDIGSYWHLDTRQDEWDKMKEGPLKEQAKNIHDKLNSAKLQTIIHGDAKVANFLFHEDHSSVAALDFQYVGKGCGIKDVVYFLGSVLYDDKLEKYSDTYLQFYYDQLKKELKEIDITDLIKEWKELYPYAIADFERFLLGWMPKHQKLNGYTKRISDELLKNIISS